MARNRLEVEEPKPSAEIGDDQAVQIILGEAPLVIVFSEGLSEIRNRLIKNRRYYVIREGTPRVQPQRRQRPWCRRAGSA